MINEHEKFSVGVFSDDVERQNNTCGIRHKTDKSLDLHEIVDLKIIDSHPPCGGISS